VSRARFIAALALLWSCVQATSLVLLYGSPLKHIAGWIWCLVFLFISAGLWFRARWARPLLLIAAAIFAVVYVSAYHLATFPCPGQTAGYLCAWADVQPVMVVAMLIFGALPLASNNRSKGRDA
jgi:hypothetical protein